VKDKAMKKLALAVLILFPIVANASWYFDRQEDAFDAENNRYLAYTTSTTDRDSQLMVACMDNYLSIRIDIADHLDIYMAQVMDYRYRVDKGEIVEDDGMVNKHGTLVLMGSSVEPLMKLLRSGQVLSIELTEADKLSVRHTFSLSGSSKEINKAVTACAK
jgi:hypothetical protein